MLLLKLIFWLAFAFDVGAVGLIFVLGLAAAGPSHTNPLEVLFKLLILPAIVLAALAFWFVRVPSTGSRLLALFVVASPFVFVAVGAATTGLAMLANPEEAKKEMSFRPVPLTGLQNAILANDLAEVRRVAAAVNLKDRFDAGGPLLLSLNRLAKSPDQLPVLQALLDAGANPNRVDGALPLESAIEKNLADATLMLLRSGADPNKRNQLGDPVVFAAAKPGVSVELLKMVLDNGGNTNALNFRGESLLMRAQSLNNKQAVQLLTERSAK